MQEEIVLPLGSFLPSDCCLWFYVSVALNVKINVHCLHLRHIYMFKISIDRIETKIIVLARNTGQQEYFNSMTHSLFPSKDTLK